MRRRLGLVPDCHQSAQWRPSLFFFFSLFISLAWFAGVVRFGGARRKRGSREDDSRRFRSVRVRMHAGDYRGGCRELCRRGQARGTAPGGHWAGARGTMKSKLKRRLRGSHETKKLKPAQALSWQPAIFFETCGIQAFSPPMRSEPPGQMRSRSKTKGDVERRS